MWSRCFRSWLHATNVDIAPQERDDRADDKTWQAAMEEVDAKIDRPGSVRLDGRMRDLIKEAPHGARRQRRPAKAECR